MNKRFSIILTVVMMAITVGCALPLKMDPPPTPDLSYLKPLPYTAGLYIPQELKAYKYELATSPVDKMVYPIGEQTTMIFEQCTPKVFSKVVPVDSTSAAQGVDVIVKPSIVKFDAVVPNPAYNPYTATMVYRADVFSPDGKKIFTQTAKGDAQSSKGLMSGFSARGICAHVAQKAMAEAAKQVMEGIADAEELAHLK
jgi:hypothetical protein